MKEFLNQRKNMYLFHPFFLGILFYDKDCHFIFLSLLICTIMFFPFKQAFLLPLKCKFFYVSMFRMSSFHILWSCKCLVCVISYHSYITCDKSQNHMWRHAKQLLCDIAFLGVFSVFMPIFRRFHDITALWCWHFVIWPFCFFSV